MVLFCKTLSPFHPGMLLPRLVETDPMVLENGSWEDFLMLFRNYLPLEKGMTLYLDKLESPSAKDALCQVLLKLGKWFLRRWKCEITDRQMDRKMTDNRRLEKLTWAFSSGELKSQLQSNFSNWIFGWRFLQKKNQYICDIKHHP